MNIWRVKSKTGATVHLTSDMEKTFCNRTVGADWKFLFLLNDRTEALEHVDGLCEKCNAINLEEWEKEFVDNDGSESESTVNDNERIRTSKAVKKTAEPVVESDSGTAKPVRADRTKGLGTW